jgi:hypothetical protein
MDIKSVHYKSLEISKVLFAAGAKLNARDRNILWWPICRWGHRAMSLPLWGRAAFLVAFLIGGAGDCRSETVDVKYRGSVDLAPFKCASIDRSSFIHRVCYDAANSYMIVQLNEVYYHYCDIDKATVDAFNAAESMGRFFNSSIKGHFDCRTGSVPSYR